MTKMRATVIIEWEEEYENWAEEAPKNDEELLALVEKYANNDMSYVLDCDDVTISKIEVIADV